MRPSSSLMVACIGAAIAMPARADISSNLVGWWKLDESSGTAVNDTSSNNNDATTQGSPSWTTGYRNNGIQLNGTNQYIQVPDSASLDTITTAMTATAWVYRSASGGSMVSRTVGTGANEYYNFAWSGNRLQVWMNKTGSVSCTNTSDSALSTWLHVAFTWDGANVRLYINGDPVGNACAYSATLSYSENNPVTIGVNVNNSTPEEDFNGKIDDVRLFARALTESDIEDVMNGVDSDPGPRYWIGTSSDAWTDDAKWSTTAGGANDTVAPTSSDTAYFTGSTVPKMTGTLDVKGIVLSGTFSGNLNVASGGVAGLLGAYYDGMTLSGTPTTVVDTTVDFNNTVDTRASAVIGQTDTYSVRWTGQVYADYTGSYNFCTVTDDGARLWVNGQQLVNDWQDQASTENCGAISLTAGNWYDVTFEFYENTNGATARLLWEKTTSPTITKAAIPSTKLRTGGPATLTIGTDGLTVNAGTFTAASTTLTVSGPVTLAGGTLTLAAQSSTTFADDFSQSAGTFTPPSSSLTLGSNFSLSGGTFTAPSGTMTVVGAFSQTAGTFTHNSGTVHLTSTADETLTTTGTSFYNLTVGSGAAVAAGTNEGLVLYWKLDETAGTSAADASGNGRTGTWVGTPSPADDRPAALDFTSTRSLTFTMASTHAIQLTSAPTTLKPSEFTISAWYKATAVDTGGSDVLSMGDNYILRLKSTQVEVCRRKSGAWPCVTANVTGHLDGNWHHIAATFSTTAGLKLYFDNVDKGTSADTAAMLYDQGTTFFVGRHGNGNGGYDFGGTIDEVRVYDRVLTTTELGNLYTGYEHASGGSPAHAGLLGYWKLDETSVTTNVTAAADASGNARNGTYRATAGAVTPAADKPTPIQFTDARSQQFTMASQHAVEIPDPGTVFQVQRFTMAAWYKATAVDTSGSVIMANRGSIDLRLEPASSQFGLVIRAPGSTWQGCWVAVSNPLNGNWHHVAATYDVNGFRLYFDGVEVNSCAYGGAVTWDYPTATSLWLARHSNLSSSYDFGGSMDDARFYGRALTKAEMANLYAGYEYAGQDAPGTAPTFTLATNLTVASNLTISANTTLHGGSGSRVLTVGGNWTRNGTFTAGNGTVALTGSGTRTLPNEAFHGLTINNASGVWNLGAALTATGDLTITAGTLNTSASNHAVNIAGSFTSAGTFTANSSTVTLNGTASGKTLNVTSNLHNLSVTGSGGVWTMGRAHTMTGDVTIGAGATLASGNFDMTVGGNWANSGSLTEGTGRVVMNGTGARTISAETFNDLELNNAGGTWTMGGALVMGDDLNITAGTLSVSGSNYAITVGGDFTVGASGNFTKGTGTVTLQGAGTGGNVDLDNDSLHNLVVNSAGDTWTLLDNLTVGNDFTLTAGSFAASTFTIYAGGNWLNNGGTFTAGTSTVNFNAASGTKTITSRAGQKFYNLTISGAATVNQADAIEIDGDYTQTAGTFGTQGFAKTLAGSFNKTGGAYGESTCTFTLDGTATGKTLNFQTDLYRLVVSGSGSWTVQTGALLVLDTATFNAGTFNTGSVAFTSTGLATVAGGTLAIGSGGATMTGGMTVSSGTLDLSSTGTLNLTNGTTLSVTGTLRDTSTAGNSTIRATSGGTNTFAFTVNSGATVNVDGMNIQDTDASGMRFPAASGVTFTSFKNVAFSGGATTAGAKYLNMTATALDLMLLGFSFDNPGAGTYNVALAGDGTANQTQLVLECNTSTGVGGAGCGDARDADDDANDDGVADNPATNGGIVHWLRNIKTDLPGTLVGMPVRAINWNNFTYYATYAGYNSANGTQARVTVRDADGTSAYYYDFTAGETMTGPPRPYHDGTNRYVFVGMTNGKLYKLVDNGSNLAVATNWPTTYGAGSTISTPLSVDGTYVYFAGLSGDAVGASTYRAVFRVTHTGASPVWGSIFGTGTSATAALTAAPSLARIAATDYLFFGVEDHFFRVQASNMTGNDNTVASGAVNSRITIVNDRFLAADDVGKLWVMNATQATLGQLWVYQDTANHGGSCSTATCKIANFYVHLKDDFTERVYWGDADGHVYAVKQNGAGGSALTGYPFRPDSATDAYNAAPLFDNGALVVGTAAGNVYVINAATTADGTPSVARVYRFGSGNSVASINMDRSTYGGAGGYVVATTNGRWYYLPRYTDPDVHR